MTQQANATVVDSLNKSYGHNQAVVDVSFSVARGQVLVVLGPNGAGKTTLLKIIAGLTTPDSGSVRLNGYDLITEREKALQQVTALLQNGNGSMTECSIWDSVCHSPQCERLLSDFGLWDRRDDPVSSLSHGLQPRVALVRILSGEQPILLLDEPTMALEEQAARTAQAWIRKLTHEHGKTCLVATCQIDLAREIGDRIIVMKNGRIVADTPSRTAYGLTEPAVYQIRVKGRLDQRWATRFSGSTITPLNGETVVSVPVADQPALYGLLTRVRDLGLVVVSVQRVEHDLLALLDG